MKTFDKILILSISVILLAMVTSLFLRGEALQKQNQALQKEAHLQQMSESEYTEITPEQDDQETLDKESTTDIDISTEREQDLSGSVCLDTEVGSDARERCQSKPGCEYGFFELEDPRDGSMYIKAGCDTIDKWSEFRKNTPSSSDLLTLNCRFGNKTQAECSALSHCEYNLEYSMCLNKE